MLAPIRTRPDAQEVARRCFRQRVQRQVQPSKRRSSGPVLSRPPLRRSGRHASSWPGILDGCPAADDAALCLSELVTNASVHSRSREPGGHFTVTAAIRGGQLQVDVRDEGGPWTQPVRGRDGLHGRGLLIVGQLACDWGRTGDSATGWTVWFTMNMNSPATTSPQHTEGETIMTEPGPAAPVQYDPQGLRAMAADLTAHGLTTHLTDSRAGLDLTATLSPSGRREAELIIDEDGYAELRYWIPSAPRPLRSPPLPSVR